MNTGATIMKTTTMKTTTQWRLTVLASPLLLLPLCARPVPAFAAGPVVLQTQWHAEGLDLQAGSLPVAPEGKVLVMSVNGVETPIEPGTYRGKVVLEVLDGTKSDLVGIGGDMGSGGPMPMPMPMPGGPGGPGGMAGPPGGPPGVPPGGGGEGPGDTTANVYRSALFIQGGAVVPGKSARSVLRGARYDAKSLHGAAITAKSPGFNGITLVNQDYALSGLEADISGDGGNDMSGLGSAVAVFQGSSVEIARSRITTHGTARSGVFAGSYDIAHPARVTIRDSTIIANGHNTVVPTAVWMLGLYGDVRAVQFVGYYDNLYDHVTIKSAGWAVLSVDGVKPPTQAAVAKSGILAAYDPASGFGSRRPHEFLGLYSWSGRNTVRNSDLSILGIPAGGWGDGYGSYSIGANLNAFDATRISNVSYGSIVANEYASVSFVNGSVVNSNRFGVYSHSNKGGVINVDHSTFNTREAVFLLKSTDGGFGPNATMIEVNHSRLNNTGNGVVLLFMDNDDPGMGKPLYDKDGRTQIDQKIDIQDRIAVKDAQHDPTQEHDYRSSRFMSADVSYMYNAYPVASFTDCKGKQAIQGDFYNARTGSQNLVLHFSNCDVRGIISSGSTRHRVDIIRKGMKITDADYVQDGVRCGNRNHLGRVDASASATVNNGVIVYLEKGSGWKVRGTSYVAKLVVAPGSRVEGVITAASTIKGADGSVSYVGAVVDAAR